MGGPEMAPHTPQRSQRPGEPGALLEDAAARSPQNATSSQRSQRPGNPGRFLKTRQPAPLKTRHHPSARQRPGKPGALLEDAAARYLEDATSIPALAAPRGNPGRCSKTRQPASPRRRDIRTLGAPRGTGALLESRTTLRRAARD